MAENDTREMTGPWVLALGALGVGVAAMAAEIRRRHRREDGDYRSPEDV